MANPTTRMGNKNPAMYKLNKVKRMRGEIRKMEISGVWFVSDVNGFVEMEKVRSLFLKNCHIFVNTAIC
ncbi:MAG: hypothetical protein WBV73_04805 [Phormidium sp.]